MLYPSPTLYPAPTIYPGMTPGPGWTGGAIEPTGTTSTHLELSGGAQAKDTRGSHAQELERAGGASGLIG